MKGDLMPDTYSKKKPGRPPTHPPVVILETGEVFDTFKEAAAAVGGDGANVRRVVYGVQSHHKGYHFALLSNN